MNLSTMERVNETLLEVDPVAEIDEQFLTEYERFKIIWTIQEVMIIAKLILCLVVAAAAMFMVVTILRFKRLQTRLNMYILNMFILVILFYFVVPVLALTLAFTLPFFNIFYYIIGIQNLLLMLYITFTIALAIDWTVSSFKPVRIEEFQKYYRYFFIGLYIFYCSFFLTMIFTEIAGIFFILPISYVICMKVLIFINILKKLKMKGVENHKTAYALNVSNISIISFLPTLIFYLLVSTVFSPGSSFTSALIFTLVEPFFVIITMCHPIIIIYYLGRENKYFKMAYNKSFNRNIRDYGDENLDDFSEAENPDLNKVAVNYSNGNGVDENKQVLII